MGRAALGLVVCMGGALATAACAPRTDVAPAASVLAPEGPLTGGGAAGGWIAVTVYDGWNRTVLAGATVYCHETGDTAASDSAGRAWLRAPAGPFTVTGGGVAGYGLATVADATTAAVGLPLPALTPRIVGVRGTVTQILDATASRVEVPDGRGGTDPLLASTASDTYQLAMAAGRNFRVTALEIGTSGLSNIVVSPVELKAPPHKTVVTVDMAFPTTQPSIATCSGALTYPAGFVAAGTTVWGRVRTDLDDVAESEGVVVGWGTLGAGGVTFALDHAPAVTAGLSPSDHIVDALTVGGAGEFSRVRLPHAASATGPGFPASVSLTFPALPYPTSPAGTSGTGLTPTLQWTSTVAAGVGAYTVTLTDAAGSWRWECWVRGGTGSVALPALPPALAGAGPAIGSAVQWDVRAWHCPALAWDAVTLRRLALDATGATRAPAASFTP